LLVKIARINFFCNEMPFFNVNLIFSVCRNLMKFVSGKGDQLSNSSLAAQVSYLLLMATSIDLSGAANVLAS